MSAGPASGLTRATCQTPAPDHRRMATLARVSLAWIVIGGIPRALFYSEFEWANAAGRGQLVALAVKHVVALGFVGFGVWLWRRLGVRVAEARRGAEDVRRDPVPRRPCVKTSGERR